jgi:hypothetical protein
LRRNNEVQTNRSVPKTFILVFETDDELAKGLLEFAEQEKLSADFAK